MTPELENKLIKQFPMIFADRYASMTHTCMCWGMECGDGWYDIIYLACLGIKEEYKKMYPWYVRVYHRLAFEFIPRWNAFISKQPEWMYKRATVKYGPVGKEQTRVNVYKRFYLHMPYWAKASQIKEKFGTLRFYLTCGTDKMHEYASMAEEMSSNRCEQCGKYGKLRGNGWLYTACDEHTKEQDKVEENENI